MSQTPKLVLHPERPDLTPRHVDELVGVLRDAGLIDGDFTHQAHTRYYAGPRFLDLMVFLGCSPSVALSPGDAGHDPNGFCQVAIDGPHGVAVLRLGDPSVRPRCPRCRTEFFDWDAYVQRWLAGAHGHGWSCPRCSAALQPDQFDWRHEAGIGRIFIEVWGVYPQEAVPADSLLEILAALTGCPWGYFYTRS